MKKITIKEYAEQVGKTKEAILYQIKKGKLRAEQDKNKVWFIFIEEEQKEENKINDFQAQELENKIKLLEQEVELKNEIILNKNETIETQKEVIQAEKRTSFVLGQSYQDLKEKQAIISIENIEVKKEIIKVKENNLISLNDFLNNAGFSTAKKRNIKSRFNRREGKEKRIIKKEGYFYLDPQENYKDLIYGFFWKFFV